MTYVRSSWSVTDVRQPWQRSVFCPSHLVLRPKFFEIHNLFFHFHILFCNYDLEHRLGFENECFEQYHHGSLIPYSNHNFSSILFFCVCRTGPLIPGWVKLVSDDLTLILPLYPNCLSSALPILHGGVIVRCISFGRMRIEFVQTLFITLDNFLEWFFWQSRKILIPDFKWWPGC